MSNDTYFVSFLRQHLVAPTYFFGLNHSWAMFCQTDWNWILRFEVRYFDSKDQLIELYRPESYEMKKWFAEMGLNSKLLPSIADGLISFFIARAPANASRVILISSLQSRPSLPTNWFGKFAKPGKKIQKNVIVASKTDFQNWEKVICS